MDIEIRRLKWYLFVIYYTLLIEEKNRKAIQRIPWTGVWAQK